MGITKPKSRLAVVGAWLLCAARAVVAQAPAQQRPVTEPAVRVTTRLVEVSVVVRNKAGEPVADLTRDDFALFDKGREQTIAIFHHESSPAHRPPPAPLPRNTFSNRFEETAGSPTSATAILLDGLNTRFADRAYARQQLVRFLEQVRPGDCVGVYALAQGLRVVHDLTRDAASLLRAIAEENQRTSAERVEPEADESLAGWPQFDAWMGEVNRGVAEMARADRTLRTIRALLAIANHLERVPGRKNLIWVAGQFPTWFDRAAVPTPEQLVRSPDNFGAEIERTARALSNAGVAIYPIDARGLVGAAEYGADRASIRPDVLGSSRGDFGVMMDLAGRTGGRAFFNTNDIRGAIRRAVDDGRETYILGYYPTHAQWDGRFRTIKVGVRRPGKVLHRHGYFALPEEPVDETRRQGVLEAAKWSPIDATRVGLTIRVGRIATGLELTMEIDPRDITLQPREGAWMGQLDVMMVQFALDERNLRTVSHTVNLKLDRRDYLLASERGALILTERIELVPGVAMLRLLVRDVRSGALGSVSVPVSRLSS